jgi:signal transduction histidine kinase
LPPPPAPLLIAIAVAGCLATAGAILLGAEKDASAINIGLLLWISVPYIVAGTVAWWRRPDSRLGPLMIIGGFATEAGTLQFADNALLQTVGGLCDILPAALFLHVYLAFPDGRLRSTVERVVVGCAYIAAIGLQVVKAMLGGIDEDNLLVISTRPDAAHTVEQVQLLSIAAMCLVAIGLLADRRRHAGRPLRRPLALVVDSFVVGLAMLATLFTVAAMGWSHFIGIQRATLLVLGISPIVFGIALLDQRLARSAVGDLVIDLHSGLAPDELRAALRRALRDPSLELAYWLPEFETYADLDGREAVLPAPGDRRAMTVIERDGAPVAALLHDPSVLEERELLDGVSAAAALALENTRLQVELRARLEELRGSRARIVEAGQRERKRLERNLHDGAQQRLVALSLELGMLQAELGDNGPARERLGRARTEIAASLQELREIARGIHPAVVTGHGLAVALDQLAALAPVPVEVSVTVEERLPESLEVAAYYLVSESLANVGKYADATSATVEVSRTDGVLLVEIVDDGIGGADTDRGSGLRGLADRIETLDGRLRVWSPPGGGTRVRAEIPCA